MRPKPMASSAGSRLPTPPRWHPPVRAALWAPREELVGLLAGAWRVFPLYLQQEPGVPIPRLHLQAQMKARAWGPISSK